VIEFIGHSCIFFLLGYGAGRDALAAIYFTLNTPQLYTRHAHILLAKHQAKLVNERGKKRRKNDYNSLGGLLPHP
jgi:hypothetical protein